MKNPAAYYLLLIYLFALCKPVMPLVQDVVAHTFFEHQHLASVHQHGGNGHVKKEVGQLAEQEQPTSSATTKGYDEVPLHLAASLQYNLYSQKTSTILHYSFYSVHFPATTLAIQLPPPRV